MSISKFQPEKKEIEGVEFHIYPFKAIIALKLKAFFLKKLAPAFGQLIGEAEFFVGFEYF